MRNRQSDEQHGQLTAGLLPQERAALPQFVFPLCFMLPMYH
jgi:hypothetical protein